MIFFSTTRRSPTQHFFVTCLLILLLVASIFAVLPQQAEAFTPFGGQILSVMWCVCSRNLMVTVGPPVPIIAMYEPGQTILYMFGQIWRPGPWVLGLWGSPSACIQPWGHRGSCIPIAFPPRMIMVGTSM
jgi:hypothetical protein